MHQNNGHPSNLVKRHLTADFQTPGQISEKTGLSIRMVNIGLSRLILKKQCLREFKEYADGTEYCVYKEKL